MLRRVFHLFVIVSSLFVRECYSSFNSELDELVSVAKKLSESHFNPDRTSHVESVLRQAAGIYARKRNKSSRLSKTVLINVVEATGERWNSPNYDKYKQLLMNHLCFSKRFDLETVVYIANDNRTQFAVEAHELQSIDKSIKILEYPNELFWKIVGSKSQPVSHKGGSIGYDGTVPSFRHFGFLVMLVPIYEALMLGFNVIYFDVDIAFMRDPIPHMIAGTADFILSLEKRSCIYPTILENRGHFHWNELEPNTGTLFAASNNKTITYFYEWIHRIVEENRNNDQKVLQQMFQQLSHQSQQVYDCNAGIEQVGVYKGNYSEEKVNYCYLSELLFQNGKIAFNCALNRHGSRAEYLLGLAALRYYGSSDNYSLPERPVPFTDTVSELSLLQEEMEKDMERLHTISPVAVHANYCDNKKLGLANMGLWLAEGDFQSEHCKVYEYDQTFFGKIDWKTELQQIANELQHVRHMRNNTVFKFNHRPQVYIYNNVTQLIRPFYSGEVFLKLGYQWSDMMTIKTQYSYFMNFTHGPVIEA